MNVRMATYDGTTGIQTVDLSTPAGVMKELALIETDLGTRQNKYEHAAAAWFNDKAEIERDEAVRTLRAAGANITERKVAAKADADIERLKSEARYEAQKAAIRVLETRANVCMALLKAQGKIPF